MERICKPFPVLCLCWMYILLTSCGGNKRIAYFNDIPDDVYTAASSLPTTRFSDPVIQPNDIVQISILTLDPQINQALSSTNAGTFDVQAGSSNLPAGSSTVSGFLVDNNGIVELPIVGKVKIAGLTTSVARDTIHNRVELYYKSPVVNVRFTNFTITVLGEVARPSTYILPNEKVSILDAIGMAGDLTIYGRRENVLLIRDSAGQKQTIRFDLNSSKMLTSPYFYLRQGDMIYVEPNKSKVASTDAVRTRNYALIASGLSLLVVIFSRIK